MLSDNASDAQIKQLSLAFDQVGRPIIFYRENSLGVIKLFWYDPTASSNQIINLGQGAFPRACFDFPHDASQGFSDVLLFYVRNDSVFMRIQRDRFQTEYPTPVTASALNKGVRIRSAGLRADNRVQVLYDRITSNGSNPTQPGQPNGKSFYKIPDWRARSVFLVSGADMPLYTQQNVPACSFGFVINEFATAKAQIVSGAILLTLVSTLMPRAEQMWPDMELTLLIYPAQKKFTLKTYASAYPSWNYISGDHYTSYSTLEGIWSFEIEGPVLVVNKDGEQIFRGSLHTYHVTEALKIAKKRFSLVFGGIARRQGGKINAHGSFTGVMSNVWLKDGATGQRYEFAINNRLPEQQGFNNSNLIIHEHNPLNWQFVPD
jgi:hypothetical protein